MSSNNAFTSNQAPEVNHQTCARCHDPFGLDVIFEYVPGPPGERGRMCCPDCAKHYADKRRLLGAAHSTGVPVPQINDFTIPSANQLKKASAVAQHGGILYPAQRFPVAAGSGTAMSGPPNMMPPPTMVPTGSRMTPQTQSDISGYRPDHALYNQHRVKMVAQTLPYSRPVTISLAMHTLKPEGKSGTVLIGNIERDYQVLPTVTHLDLHNTVIAVLKPLWDAWSSSYPFPSHAEMHRSPKLLLYDPTQPNVPSGPAILDFFYTTRGRAASTVFQPSKRITILLIITHDVYEAALEWKEQKMESSDTAASETLPARQIPGLTDDRVDALLGVNSSPKRNKNGKRLRAPSTSNDFTADGEDAAPSPTPSTSGNQAEQLGVGSGRVTRSHTKAVAASQAQKSADQGSQNRDGGRSTINTRNDESQGSRNNTTNLTGLNEALALQGEQRNQAGAFMKQLALDVQVYIIPNVDLDQVISKKTFALDASDVANRCRKSLYVDTSAYIGTVGGFKTCHNARFGPSDLAGPLQGTVLDVPIIIAKRPFLRRLEDQGPDLPPKVLRVRMSSADELPKLLDESNCIYWGAALLDLAYKCISRQPPSRRPALSIPQLRFVRAGLAVPIDRAQPVYLVEELIPGAFIKYLLKFASLGSDDPGFFFRCIF